jgi:hypothetical protein
MYIFYWQQVQNHWLNLSLYYPLWQAKHGNEVARYTYWLELKFFSTCYVHARRLDPFL